MSKQTVKGSAFGGIFRTSGESEEPSSEGVSTHLPPSAKKLEEFPVKEILILENVRTKYSKSSLQELADSIKEHGLLEPIGLDKIPDPKSGKYKLVYGHRRFKAITEILKYDKVKATLVDSNDGQDRTIIQLLENIQREDLSDSELAISLKAIKEADGKSRTNSDLAKMINKSEDWIKDKIDHSGLVGEGVSTHLSTSFIRETRGLPTKARIELLDLAETNSWTQKELREQVKKQKPNSVTKSKPKKLSNRDKIQSLELEIEHLKERLAQKQKELKKLKANK